jgi:hypothetical protein
MPASIPRYPLSSPIQIHKKVAILLLELIMRYNLEAQRLVVECLEVAVWASHDPSA